MSASSPGPDDKSGITEIKVGGSKFFVQRTVNTITVFNEGWGNIFSQVNLGQSDAVVAEAVYAYREGSVRGEEAGRANYRRELLRMLGAQPAKEEG